MDSTFVLTFLTQADLALRHSSVSWRQWRTMSSCASRSVGIRKFNGLLVLAAELCGIVRASYLSPSFPFFLCFELWQYLRSTRHGRRPSRKVTPGSPSTLPLLRAAALAVMLMLPAEGWAQVQVAPEFPPAPAAPVPPQMHWRSSCFNTSADETPLFAAPRGNKGTLTLGTPSD